MKAPMLLNYNKKEEKKVNIIIIIIVNFICLFVYSLIYVQFIDKIGKLDNFYLAS